MTRQLNVYPHPQPSRRGRFPYIVVLQHDSVEPRSGQVLAAPLTPFSSDPDRLQPLVDIEGDSFQLLTPFMDRIPVRRLEAPVASLESHSARIIKAIDMLFVGS